MFLKKLFCRHAYYVKENIYGDRITYSGYNRSIIKCSKCNREKYYPYLLKIGTEIKEGV